MVSCYVLKTGRIIIVAMNDTEKPVQTIAFDAAKLKALGVADLSLRNLETAQDAKVADGTIDATVPPRDYILLGNFEVQGAK